MKIEGKSYKTIWFENNLVKIIDQTKLPHQFVIKNLKTVKDAINAITKTLSDAYNVSRLVAQVILLISCLTCLTNCAGFVLAIGSLSCKKKMIFYIFF